MWNKFKLWLLPALGYAAIRGLRKTLRLRTVHAERVESLWGAGKNVIIAFWHGRQVMMPWVYTRRRMAGSRIQVLVSEHRDGELIARILQWFRFGTVRGSTTRGGTRALRQMVRAGRSGQDLAVTPDGPRGPRCVAQRGVIQLAKLTGLPIAPVTFAASKKNSSEAGIVLSCRSRSVAPTFSGGSRSGSRPRRTLLRWRRSGWSWKQR